MGINLDLLPDKPKQSVGSGDGSRGLDLDVLPDKPGKIQNSVLDFDLLPDKPAPRKDFAKEVLPGGMEMAKSALENAPIFGGLSPKQYAMGYKALHEVIERPVAGLRAIAKEGPTQIAESKSPSTLGVLAEKLPAAISTFKKGFRQPEKYPVGTFAESLVDSGMEPTIAGALGSLADVGYYFGVPEAIGRVATSGKVKLLEGTIKNINEAFTKAGETRTGVVNISTDTIKNVAREKDIGTIANAYIKSKKAKFPRRTNLLPEEAPVKSPVESPVKAPAEVSRDVKTFEIAPTQTKPIPEVESPKPILTPEAALDKAPADLHEAWYAANDNFTSMKEPIVKEINDLKAKRKSISRGKEGQEARKEIDERIETLSNQLTEAETKIQDENVSFQMNIADKAIKMAQEEGLNLGEYSGNPMEAPEGWQEFRDDILTRLYERPYIEANWDTPVKDVIQETIGEWKEKTPEALTPDVSKMGFPAPSGEPSIPSSQSALGKPNTGANKSISQEKTKSKASITNKDASFPVKENLAEAIEEPEGAFASSSTGAGFPKASSVPEEIPSAQEHKIDMPELVKLATDLMNRTPVVKKLAKNYGYFKAGKQIALDVEIFKNPHFAGSVLAHEVGHLIDWLPDYTLSRGNLLGRVMTLKRFLKQTFGDLSNKTIRDELKALTAWWNPFNELSNSSYTRYRYSAKELYAEAISVLLNQPEKLEEIAPTFYKGFWQNIDNKPDVKEALLELQNFLNLGEGEKLRIRKEDIHGMFKKGEALFYEERNKHKLNRKDLWFKIRTELIDKNTALLDKIKELDKKGIKLNPEDNPKYYLEEYNYIGGKIKNLLDGISKDVISPLTDIGVSMEDFGEYLFLNRVVTDRADIANPLGHNRITAEKQLNYMKEHFGEERYTKIRQAAGRFQQTMKELLSRSESSGLIKSDIYSSIVTNPSYATFQVLDYIDDYVSPAIIKQTGTLKGIANPFTSTVIKMISTLRSIERNNTRLAVVKFMRQNFPKEIEEAKIKRYGKYKAEVVEKDGFGVIQTREHGKVAGYYVDPYIAQTLTKEPSTVANGIVSVLRFLNSGYFRPVYVNLNLGFQSFNMMRDFIRAWKLNPNVTFPQMLKKYYEAIPIAKRRVWGDFSDPIINQMQEEGMLSLTFNDLLRGMNKDEETHIDFLLEKYNVVKKSSPAQRSLMGKLINPLMKYLNYIEELGNFIETLPKVSGYLSRMKTGKSMKEIAHEVRVYSGSPDFLRKGQGYDWYNNVFLFSNAIKEGLRGDVEGAFSNPKTRAGYWWRTAKLNMLPKLVMFLASMGFFGQAIKDNFDKQTEYDKTNYVTLPLGQTEGGRAVYFRVPQDEVGRLLGGIFWKVLNFEKEEALESLQDIGSLAAGQVPSFSPVIELISSWSQYVFGKTPYDWFRGRSILSKEEQTAGGWYSLEPMLRWTAGKLGVYSLTIKAKREDETTFEKVVKNAPIIQRFLRITDYGQIEKDRKERKDYQKFKAARTLDRRR